MEQPREGIAHGSSHVFPGTAIAQAALPVPLKSRRVFSRAWLAQRQPDYEVKLREGSGLTVISALHYQLNAREQDALSAFRLAQYVNAEFYDIEAVKRYQLSHDPAMAELAPYDYHGIVANEAGDILSYMCLQTPILHRSMPGAKPGALPVSLYYPMSFVHRPIFPVEIEFGQALYGRHCGMRSLPAASAREISTLIRDVTLPKSVVTDIALVETIVATAEYVMNVKSRVEAVIGCIAPDARRLLYNLGIPMAYAPFVEAQALPYATAFTDPGSGELVDGARIWAQHAYEPGMFWPFALATADLRLDGRYFAQLEDTLAQERVEDIWARLRVLRRDRPLRVSRYLISARADTDVFWTKEVSLQRIARASENTASK